MQQRNLYLGGYVELANGVRPGLYYFTGKYRPATGAPGEFSAVVHDDAYWLATIDLNTRSSRLGYGFSYASGTLGGGAYRYIPAYIWFRPRPSLYFSVYNELLKSFGSHSQTIFIGKWDVTSTDAIGFRFVRSSGEKYYRLSYGRQVRAGVDVLAVVDKQPLIGIQASLKLLVTFQ